MRETLRKYGKAVVMVADVPAVSTYLAMGYTPSKAKSKARLKGNSLKNRTSRVLDEMGIDSSMVTIIDWANEVETSKFYIQSLIEVKDLYANNSAFHKIVFETSGSVLHGSKVDITDENIEQATEYLLAELAFIQASVDIL
jgi:tRNA-dependent cyclodipeptide synthase